MNSYYINQEAGAVISLMRFNAPELEELASDPEEIWLITSVGVQEKHRGKGHASALLRDVLNDADVEGVTLCLSIASDCTGLDELALRLWYARYGFVPISAYEPNSLYRPPAKPAA